MLLPDEAAHAVGKVLTLLHGYPDLMKDPEWKTTRKKLREVLEQHTIAKLNAMVAPPKEDYR